MKDVRMFIGQAKSQQSGKQSGFVLITALILVVILTILALAGEVLNSTQTRIAANTASQQTTFQAAEGALNQAQTDLYTGLYTKASFLANSNGLYTYNQNAAPLWTTVNWNSGGVIVSAWGGLPTGVRAAFIIEMMPSVNLPGGPSNVYRITAYATQSSGGSPIMLQSMVLIPI